MDQSNTTPRPPTISADEFDLCSGYDKLLAGGKHKRSKVKRGYRRRERRLANQDARRAAVDGA